MATNKTDAEDEVKKVHPHTFRHKLQKLALPQKLLVYSLNIFIMLVPETVSSGVKQYLKLQDKLLKQFAADDYVVIDPHSGAYFVGETSVAAMKKARTKYPRGKLFLAQVGRMAGLMK